MPNLEGTVGEGGTNRAHEVALIQVMLRVVKDKTGKPYLSADYDGSYGPQTQQAIVALQADVASLIAAAAGGVANAAKRPIPAVESAGILGPNTPSYQILVKKLPPQYACVRAMEGLKTIYLESTETSATQSGNLTRADMQLNQPFRLHVWELIQEMFQTYKIAIWVEPVNGRLRTFDRQQELLVKRTTQAGPGESNHNWGFAVDIGFKDFEWLARDTSIVADDYWLSKLAKVSAADTTTLWENRNKIAAAKQLYKTAFRGDLIHLQSFDDSNVSMQKSLAAQMQRVGKFKWSHSGRTYATDMGTGAAQEGMGTASQLWLKQSTPSAALVARWKNQVEKKAWEQLDAAGREQRKQAAIELARKLKVSPGLNPGLPVLTAADITDAILTEAREAIRKEMEAAEEHRDQWRPE